jgi:hypothetical protein
VGFKYPRGVSNGPVNAPWREMSYFDHVVFCIKKCDVEWILHAKAVYPSASINHQWFMICMSSAKTLTSMMTL